MEMRLESFLKESNVNNLMSKSRLFHNVGAAYINDISNKDLIIHTLMSEIQMLDFVIYSKGSLHLNEKAYKYVIA